MCVCACVCVCVRTLSVCLSVCSLLAVLWRRATPRCVVSKVVPSSSEDWVSSLTLAGTPEHPQHTWGRHYHTLHTGRCVSLIFTVMSAWCAVLQGTRPHVVEPHPHADDCLCVCYESWPPDGLSLDSSSSSSSNSSLAFLSVSWAARYNSFALSQFFSTPSPW